LSELEHDHVPLSRMVSELRSTLAGGAGSLAKNAKPFADTVRALRDELIEHFGKEEEGLFPFMERALPQLQADLTALATAHDGLCGAAVRMAALADRGPQALEAQFTQLAALFFRFDTAYAEHAQREVALLRRAQGLLSADDKRKLAELSLDL
jgi:hypothetical protein